jgi:pimeloyl-ACP methyl ester carboxylesterase
VRPRILLLHAFPLDCRMWAETKQALEEDGWHVSAPDLPGPEAEPSLEAWADHVLALADEPFVPVGSSMGGYLAFELWRRARDRVAGLALVGTRASGETDESRRGRDESIELLQREGVGALWEGLEGRLFAASTGPEVRSQAREIALEQGVTRLTAALAAIRDRLDSTALLAEIEVPVLVVAGEEDAIVPRGEAEEMATALRHGRFVRIEGAGHLVPLERPDELNRELLSFLGAVAG